MIKKFFNAILLKDILDALIVGVKSCFRKPVTKSLKDIKRLDNFRNNITVDTSKCIRCRLCESVCPNKSIKLTETGFPMVNKQKCCYCRLCQKACPKKALKTK